jgi:transcriptional regulator with XRE-family HTH domain
MLFSKQLVALRKKRGYTQQALADKIGIHVTQIKRYEAGTAQPTLEAFRNIILALNVSADTMFFEGMLIKHDAKRWAQPQGVSLQ